MATFLDTFSDLKKKQDALKAEFTKARAEALAHIQSIVDSFNIQSTEINFIDSPKPVKKARMYARLGSTALSWNIANQMNEAYGCDISPKDFEDEKKMEEIFRKAYTPTEDQLALRKKEREMEISKEKTAVAKEAVAVAKEMATVQKDYEDFIKDNPGFEDLFK